MSAIPINEKPYYSTDQIANSIAADDCFDCYLEPVPAIGFVTRRRPGYRLFADTGSGQPGDGLFYWDALGKVIAVSGGRIYDISSGGVCTDITGSPLNVGIPVTFADGQDLSGKPWLYLANGKLVYSKNGANTIAPTDPNTPQSTHVAWIQSRFVANEPDTNRFDFTDTNPDTSSKVFSIDVQQGSGLVITMDNRPQTAGLAWTQEISASGGTGVYTWSAVLGTAAAVTDSGPMVTLPLAAVAVGTKTLTVTLTDSADPTNPLIKSYEITFVATPDPLVITDPGTVHATAGVFDRLQLTTTGGIGTLMWSSLSLPSGITLDGISLIGGALSGTIATPGEYTCKIQVIDSQTAPVTATVSFTISVSAQPTTVGPLTITTSTLPGATIGQPYSATLTATGLVGAAVWKSGGALPVGLSITDNIISGTPTGAAGTSVSTFYLTDDAVTGFMDPAYWSSTSNPLTCEAKGDKLLSLFTAWQEIYAWGSQGMEIWQDDGVTPFSPIPGAFSEGGIEAPYSVAIADNTVLALCVIAGSRVVIKLQGRSPMVVSDAISRVLADMPTVDDAIGDLISVGGLAIYLLSFPSAGQTWAYDYKNDVWCRWGSYRNGVHQQFQGVHACFAKTWNKHLIQSRIDGRIYELSRDLYTDDGHPMRTFRRTGWINHDTYNRKRCDQFYVKAKCGASDNATLLVRYRDDGRAEWSMSIEIPLQPLGNGQFLAKMNRFGMYRSRQYEFALSDAADLVLTGVDVELTVMSS
jgi:hypothetical protein